MKFNWGRGFFEKTPSPIKIVLNTYTSFMVSCILFFFKSTLMTLTSTMSPTLTTSSGCLMNFLFVIWDMCTSPSWWTPMSTNAPKSITFRTVPLRSCLLLNLSFPGRLCGGLVLASRLVGRVLVFPVLLRCRAV